MSRIKKFADLKKLGKVNEEYAESLLQDENFIAGIATIIGVGGTLAVSLFKDYFKAKTKEEKQEALKALRKMMDNITGAG